MLSTDERMSHLFGSVSSVGEEEHHHLHEVGKRLLTSHYRGLQSAARVSTEEEP